MTAEPGLFVGCMTGTSVDGLDLALTRIHPPSSDGDDQHETLEVIAAKTLPLPSDLQKALLACGQPESSDVELLGSCDSWLGDFIGQSIRDWLSSINIASGHITAIGSHGQTVRHRPPSTTDHPFTLQIGDPNRIAEATRIQTVADFRRRDMAAGGQGAPLAPAYHQVVFGHLGSQTCVVNIGGISNLSPLDGSHQGFDSGPGNCLMDEWYRRHHGKTDADGYDAGGTWAAEGRCDTGLLNHWLTDPYFTKAPPKSTGREYFNLSWLERIGSPSDRPSASAQDLQATLAELTACSIARSITAAMNAPRFVPVCGGGRLNTHLMTRIRANLLELGHDCDVEATEHWGVDGDALEASAFAWLAYRRVCNLTGNLSAATGAQGGRILGAVYPP